MELAATPGHRLSVAVLGATGYAGVELLRLLSRHPAVEMVFLSSEQYRGRRASDVYPFLAGHVDITLGAPDPAAAAGADLVFSALPHGASAPLVKEMIDRGRRVIDISADFRLRDPAVYARWYTTHPAPELLSEAVYGLPELYRAEIARARLVACPGCFPTGALLGLAPLARRGLLGEAVVIDAKSGTTGAGRSPKVEQLFAEVNENCKAYAIAAHRHGPEIDQELQVLGAPAGAVFVPHLIPVNRGILTTMYVRLPPGTPPLSELFERAYAKEPFIVLTGDGPPPELRDVRGTNRCAIGWRIDERSGTAIVVTAIDNLGKGAAGQAVQCLNILLGIAETTGLETPALVP